MSNIDYLWGENIQKYLDDRGLCAGELLLEGWRRDMYTIGDSDIYFRLLSVGFEDRGECFYDVDEKILHMIGVVKIGSWLDFAERVGSFFRAVNLSRANFCGEELCVDVAFRCYKKIGR